MADGMMPTAVIEDTEDPDAFDLGGQTEITVEPDGTVNITSGKPEVEKPAKSSSFDANLAEDIDDIALSALASHLLDGIESDEQARRDWEDTANRVWDFLGTKLEDPSSTVSPDGTVTKMVATALLGAAMKVWSTAYAELLPVSGPVKVRDDTTPKLPQPEPGIGHNGGPAIDSGEMPSSVVDSLASALETDFNHYLTVKDKGYYKDSSRMIWERGLIGNGFKKIFRDPLKRMPISRRVKAQDLIVSPDATHLSDAARITERIRYRQPVMRRLMVAKHYRDIALVMPTGDPTETERTIADAEGIAINPTLPSDNEHLVYECYCEIGSGPSANLMGDITRLEKDEKGRKVGFPLPYRVSIDRDSREILEIRRNWKAGDPDYRPRQRYVKFGFIPGAGFYDYGLIHLIGNVVQSITMIQRATVDSTLYANFPGGIYLQGPSSARESESVFRPNPGQWMPWKSATGQKISDIFLPNPTKEPSPQAQALIAKLEGDIKQLVGIIELPVGEGRIGNTPVGTIMSYIEAVSQVPGAVHKDDHISQQEEFELLRELLAEEPEKLTEGVKSPARRWQTAQELMDPVLVPAADPNTPSQVHRLMKAQALVSVSGMPQFQADVDPRKILEIVANTMGIDSDSFMKPPQAPAPPPPPPQVIAAQIKAQSQQASDAADIQRDKLQAQAKLAEIAAEGQQREQDRGSEEVKTAMASEVERQKIAAQQQNAVAGRVHDTANAAADRAVDHTQHLQQLAADERAQKQQALTAQLSAKNPEGGI